MEVKSGRRFSSTGNTAIEIADDHGTFAHCTGVGKSVSMGTNAVFVHALGETGKFAAYDPSDMLEHLDRLRE
ncbi:hypothetical protein NYQ31_01875 [Curtobacterium flaccumfaciens]|uniref:hypothetical protein n=1 Tax=Curtobacterium flaccumfaciens TaxID=2035 RepID=UPI00217EEB31|nr:hypothetical protein [Curtobacterium flaccumfaciens]MCS6557141.1 hypothetical protein [Curtobacterium flaccumfaciens]